MLFLFLSLLLLLRKCHNKREHKVKRVIWEGFALLGFMMTVARPPPMSSCESRKPCTVKRTVKQQCDGKLPLPGPAWGADCFSPSAWSGPRHCTSRGCSSWYIGGNDDKRDNVILRQGGLPGMLGQMKIDRVYVCIQTINAVEVNHLLLLHVSSWELLPISLTSESSLAMLIFSLLFQMCSHHFSSWGRDKNAEYFPLPRTHLHVLLLLISQDLFSN